MEFKIDNLATITDQGILRAIRFIRTKPYSAESIAKDSTKEGKTISTFVIAGQPFNEATDSDIAKLIIAGKQAELYSISFTEGEEYTNSKGDTKKGINFSSFLTKAQRKADIEFEQDLKIEESRAELTILETKSRIAKSYGDVANVVDLQASAF
jgi:hypothetical protein